GKLRPSETPRDGVLRELREELGAIGRVGTPVYQTHHRYKEYRSITEITFLPVYDLYPRPRNRCAEKMIWARREDLGRYDFLPADRELIARLTHGELSLRTQK